MTFDSGVSHPGFSFSNFTTLGNSPTIWTANLANASTLSKNTSDGYNGFHLTSILWGTPVAEGNKRRIYSDRGDSQVFGPGRGTLTLNWTNLRWVRIDRPDGGSGVSGDIDNIVFTKVQLLPEMDVRGNGVSITSGDAAPSSADHTDFGVVQVSGSSVSRTFTVLNSGTADLSLSGSPKVAISGTHAGDFFITVQPASTVSGFGGTTSFSVQFNPSAMGLRTAVLSIANNDGNENPYTFALQGTGTEPEMNITGKGNSIVDGANTPNAADDTDFGYAVANNQSVAHTFTIENTGNAALNLFATNKVGVTGTHAGDFSVTVQPASPVASGDTTTFTVLFSPTAVGTRTAMLSIANNDADEDPYNFDIQGSGIAAPEMDISGQGNSIADGDTTPNSADDTDFGNADLTADTITHAFTIHNTGTAELDLTALPTIIIGGAHSSDFGMVSQPVSPVASGGSTSFSIFFNPSATGLRTAKVSIANNDADENPYDFTVQGTGTLPPEIEITGQGNSITDGAVSTSSTNNTDFGNIGVQSGSAVHIFTISNAGILDLELSGLPKVSVNGVHAGDFSVTTQPVSPVVSGSSTSFTVQFNPSATGMRSARLSISSNDNDENPFDFDIQGKGITPELNVMKSNVGSPVLLGQTWDWHLLIRNTGEQNADFSSGQLLLSDQLPTDNVSYGAVTIDNQAGISGIISCAINTSAVLNCSANSGPVSIAALSGSFRVSFSVTPSATGTFTNPTAGNCTVDPDNHIVEGDETDNDCNSDSVNVQRQADLIIINDDGETLVNPGQVLNYVITVSNPGPDEVIGAVVRNLLPPQLSNASWSCISSGGGRCTPSGTGDINDSVDLPVAADVLYTVTATVAGTAAGQINNSATVQVPADTLEADPSNNSDTDTNTVISNGITIQEEDGAPNGGDGNGDGLPDSQQMNVASLLSANGVDYITLVVSGGCAMMQSVASVAQNSVIESDPMYDYPWGLVEFTLPCENAVVTVYYHGSTSLGLYNYRKYGPVPDNWLQALWYTLPGVTFSSEIVAGQTVATATFELSDGQLGDDTGLDSVIYDLGGPAQAIAMTREIPALSPWSKILMILVLAVISLLYLRRTMQNNCP